MTLISSAVDTVTFNIGTGVVSLDATSGAPLQFTDDRAPERTYLLDSTVPWHSVEHAWGSGHVIGEGWASRWNTPHDITVGEQTLSTTHRLGDRIELAVTRRGGETFYETYRFRNVSSETVALTSLGIQTPFADLYQDADDALRRRVHAHIFTGGSWAWALAQPMSGSGRMLGLVVREGQLNGYSVESRNANLYSNARGHLVMQVTDAARNPEAFGGQPVIELAPNEEYTLSWELDWYDTVDAFLDATSAPAQFSSYAAATSDAIEVSTRLPVTAEAGVSVVPVSGGYLLTAADRGSYGITIGDDARTEVHFYADVERTVRTRAEYVLRHQSTGERPGTLA